MFQLKCSEPCNVHEYYIKMVQTKQRNILFFFLIGHLDPVLLPVCIKEVVFKALILTLEIPTKILLFQKGEKKNLNKQKKQHKWKIQHFIWVPFNAVFPLILSFPGIGYCFGPKKWINSWTFSSRDYRIVAQSSTRVRIINTTAPWSDRARFPRI